MARGALKGLKRTRPAPGEKVVVKGQLAQGSAGRSPGQGIGSAQGEIYLAVVDVTSTCGKTDSPVKTRRLLFKRSVGTSPSLCGTQRVAVLHV